MSKSSAKPSRPAVKSGRPVAKPAKTAKPAGKATAKAPPKSAAKVAAKAAPKVAPKPVKKPAAKPAPASAVKAKSVAKPPSKVPSKAPSKASPKAAPQATPKATPKASVKPAVKAPPKAPAKPSPKAAPKVAPKAATKAALLPTPTASPTAAAQRFTDRFGPAKTPARKLPEPMEPAKTAAKVDPKLANAWKKKTGRELTEDELLAMPEGEYMNDHQLEFFRFRLLAQKDDLLSNAGETTEHLREDTSIVPDPADRATIEEEHALELRTRDRERKLLKKIMQALGRIDSGDYGFCDETGEPIGLPRLLARPTATLSLEAQQRRELKQKMFGD